MYEVLGHAESRQIVKDQEYLFTKMSWPEMEQFFNSLVANLADDKLDGCILFADREELRITGMLNAKTMRLCG